MRTDLVTQYLVKLQGKVQGPFPAHALRKLPGFTLQTHVQTMGDNRWLPAFEAVDLKAYFANPVQNSFQLRQAASQTTAMILESRPRVIRVSDKPARGGRILLIFLLLAAGAAIAASPRLDSDVARRDALIALRHAHVWAEHFPQWLHSLPFLANLEAKP